MIPDHAMLLNLWEQVAANSPIDEPHVIVVPGPTGVWTAAFADDDEHKGYLVAAEHLYKSEHLPPPQWIAAMSPCHWYISDDPEPHIDAAQAFANGDPDAHESVAVSIVTLDAPVRTQMYDQPLLEPSTEVMDDVGGHVADMMSWILVQMHTDTHDGN